MAQKITPEFIQESIKHHNDYRARHGSPPLAEDKKLNQFAQEWAENLAKRNSMEHRKNNPYGENIYQAYNSNPKWVMQPLDAVKAWYEEISLYKFGEAKPKNPSAVGHFTQLVWKETEKVGVGMSMSGKGPVYVVCNYDPPGNIIGEFAKNVMPAKKSSEEIEEERKERESRRAEKEERRKKRGDKIALTPSQEKIGIQFVQPNMEVIESMDRLIAVPSEKIRVWCCWLALVGDEVDEWRHWLLSQINLVLRMSEIMIKIEEKEKSKQISLEQKPEEIKDSTSQDDKRGRKEKYEKSKEEVVEGPKEDEPTKITEDLPPIETNEQSQLEDVPEEEEKLEKQNPEPEKEKGEIENETPEDTPQSEELTPDSEPTSDANNAVDDSEEKIDTGEGKASDEIEKEGKTDSKGREGDENKEPEYAWPIGVPWKSTESDKKEEREKEELEKVKIIPIPQNEEEMMKLILDVRHKATIYRSYYQHWIETADRAKSEILDRDILKTELVYTDEGLPYFFYLKSEPDIGIGIEHDDEEILLPDITRERISSNYVNMFFNLADKPAKGGKPWI